MKDIRTVVDWLAGGAVSGPNSEDVLAQLCERMVECGVPLWRVAVFVTTLHPDVMGRRFLWQADSGVTTSNALFAILETDDYRQSPFTTVYATRAPLRRRLADSNCPLDFAVLKDLKAEGATDYAAFPLTFTDGSIHVSTWSTRQPGGFTPKQFADLEAVILPLARVAEIRALRRTAGNLIDTYVGHQTGERIMAGKIRRGYVEAIRAAIWLSDMRGFTALSERAPPQTVIDVLNRYFGCQVPPILEHGGEVMKFMGDGLLAIFPIANDADADEVCRKTLACARDFRKRIAELPAPGEGETAIRFGLALHIGEVMYGNIGGGNRLDFTCIGPAVNLAARLEKVASKLGETVVASADFARRRPDDFRRLGEHAVAGFAAPQTVFGLVN
ncbi:MAG: adenylate/guanylate cyclase domain-containing protein [Hyphomicrobiales bacterium]|nr:adenylate/guanylate cyclase domain-containing protein [Hyphomicrobiales bacterium]MDE1973208.1 adenylate/guanylate cyclase domain-containing protein [Hyphomicrobiales bacterium]